jgi:tryptophan 2,3-dioxygenase
MTAGPQPVPPHYESYLRLPVLLDSQHRLGPAEAHDELLFIAIHQVFELWFKVLLHELTDARDRMLAGEVMLPIRRLNRCHQIELLLTDQMHVLDTMAPPDFAAFRPALGTASGGQSAQFWEIEVLSAGREPPRSGARLGPAGATRLRARQAQPTLWDGYLGLLARAGLDVSTVDQRHTAYARVAAERSRAGADHGLARLGELTEALIDHDQAWSMWRTRHALAAERQIGAARGTSGSTGGSYLWSQTGARFFPELWAARGRAAPGA